MQNKKRFPIKVMLLAKQKFLPKTPQTQNKNAVLEACAYYYEQAAPVLYTPRDRAGVPIQFS